MDLIETIYEFDIIEAIEAQDLDYVRSCIAIGIDLDLVISDHRHVRYTALLFACWNEEIEIVKLLIGAGVDLEIRDEDGWTALDYVIQGGSAELTILLVEAGATINWSMFDNHTSNRHYNHIKFISRIKV